MQVCARIVTLELAETFAIARRTIETAEVVHVELRHGSVSGFGEAAPIARYGEDSESARAFVEDHAELVGDDPWLHAEIIERLAAFRGEQAAKAAFDAALFDLRGKLAGQPVHRLLGLARFGPPTAFTISLDDPDGMARRAERAAPRFRRLKLKLGGGDGLDLARVGAVRSVTRLPLGVDVNEAWSFDEAVDALPRLEELDVEFCEQPLRAGDKCALKLRRCAPIPIYVDEDCHTLTDIAPCAEIADGINIKLSKSGGIAEAVRMVHAARALGLSVMLGCMVESGLGIAAGAAVASLFDRIDLDGNLHLASDPWPGIELVDGVQAPSKAPGLGVRRVGDAG
jgi:L-alanine-DL-glutamate epimerase-like enolase superfamily enzyme